MSQKNSNAVALERRMDLASLFCMIGRHGPAVALAVVAMVSVLAGFIIYRTVRGKRRKATAAAADGESKSPAAERDAPVIRPGLEPSPEEPHSSAESTDVSDEGSSVIKEDTDLFQSDLKIRHRRAAAAAAAPAAEKKTPPYFSSQSDDQIPESKHTTSDDTEEMTVLQDSNKVAGASHNLECDAYRVAEMEVEDAADGQQGATDGSVKDVIDSWSKEPDLINDEIHAEEEKVFKAEDQEDKNVNVVKDVSDEKTRQEDKNFQCGSNNQVFFNQTSPVSGNVDDDRLQDNETKPETNSVEFSLEEPIVHIKEPNLPSSQQHDAGGLAGEVTEEDTSEGHVLTAAEFDIHPPQSGEQQPQTEQTDGNGLTCNQEKVALPRIADQEKEKKLTSDDMVACGEECDSSSVVLSPALHCLNEPVNVNNYDDDLSIVTSDTAKAQISGIVDFPDLPLDCQQPQSEVKDEEIAPPLDKDTDLTVLDSDLPPLKKAIQCENNETGEFIVLAVCDIDTITTPVMSEEISRPVVLSFSQDQQSVQTQNNEDLSELTISARPVMTVDLNPPMCQIPLTSLEKSELRDNDKDSISSPGVEEESGISSMAVSPDLHEFDMTVENMPPVMDCDAQSVKRTVAQNSLFADGVAIPDYKEDTVGMVFGPFPSRLSQQPHSEHTDESKYESFAANEDMFGHEIEDSYHRAMEQFAVQIAASTMSVTDELKNQTDVKSVVEVVEIKEKKEGVSVAKKVEAEAEKQKEEDYEKTNISIMEATMDNNEWITDSNNQVLPWMALSVPPFAQDHTKTEQLPAEDCQPSPSVTDATCVDTDTPPSTEVKQTSTLSLVDENTENNKKVVAVQPMPQNVNVTFRIHYVTHSPYQTVAVTGNQQELGNWKEFIPLERAKDGHWATVVSLPVESHVEWKFVLVDKGEVCRWEECGNRLLDTGYGDDLIVHKWWGFL